MDFVCPVLDDDTSGIDIIRGNNELCKNDKNRGRRPVLQAAYVFGQVVPSDCEAQSWVHESSSIACETSLVGDVCSHLSKSNHDEVANETDECVSE